MSEEKPSQDAVPEPPPNTDSPGGSPEGAARDEADGGASENSGPQDGAERDGPPETSADSPDAPDAADGSAGEDAPGEPVDRTAEAKPARKRPRDPAVARAFRTRRPIQGRVVGVIKGGYEVRLGRSRAFCPHSQIDLERVDDPESYVGKSPYFLITQFRRGGEDVVVSRRALLEQERLEEAKAVRATLIEGALTQGHVVGLADFGCFIDLGAGVQGLCHVSELSHRRVERVSDAVRVGDVVRVKVLKIGDEGQRISLSIRRAERDPWSGIAERFRVGEAYPGTVVRLADFGAFVEMEPGVEALAPAREFPPTSSDWRDGVSPGTRRDWRVLAVDRRKRRMSLVPVIEGVPVEPVPLEAGAVVPGRVQRVERFGVFVWLGPGQVGLLPAPLSGIPQGTRLDSRFRAGEEIRVQIVDVTEDGKRIRLAAEGVDPESIAQDRDRGAPRAARDTGAARAATSSSPPDQPFGNVLGDALRNALGRTGSDAGTGDGSEG